jgi:hypothetical protein
MPLVNEAQTLMQSTIPIPRVAAVELEAAVAHLMVYLFNGKKEVMAAAVVEFYRVLEVLAATALLMAVLAVLLETLVAKAAMQVQP